MGLFGLLHLLSAVVGLVSSVGLMGPWDDFRWEFTAAMWAGALGVAGTGVVLSLSAVGTGTAVDSGPLLLKVILTAILLGVLYRRTTVGTADSTGEDSRRSDRIGVLSVLGLWILLFGLGVLLVR